jgi:hypothetical protein
MSKKKLIEMMKDIDDNAEIAMVISQPDRDGIPEQRLIKDFLHYVGIVGFLEANAKPVGSLMGNKVYIKN